MSRKQIAVGALAVLCSAGVACDSVYVMTERYELVDDKRLPAGAGCMLAFERGRSRGASGGELSNGGDLVVTEQSHSDKFEVVVRSQGEELARRNFSEHWLESHKRDEFEVTTHAGRTFSFAYWGGDECDPPEQGEP